MIMEIAGGILLAAAVVWVLREFSNWREQCYWDDYHRSKLDREGRERQQRMEKLRKAHEEWESRQQYDEHVWAWCAAKDIPEPGRDWEDWVNRKRKRADGVIR
jgi:hypothetical protein